MTIVYKPYCVEQVNTTIANGASASSLVDGGTMTLMGIFMPSTWTAAGLSFQTSKDGGTTWVPVYQASGEYRIAAAQVGASRYIAVSSDLFNGLGLLKVVSAEAGTPVNQGAERALTLIFKQLD